MQGSIQHIPDAAALDNLARVHHGNVVGEAGDDGKVVGNPDERGAGLTADFLHLKKYLPLDGDIERGGRLVGDDDVGLVQQCNGNSHALPHAAGKLVRVGGEPLVRRSDADLDERRAATVTRVGVADFFVRGDGLDHLRVDAQHRIQGHHRILENHGNAVAAQRAPLLMVVVADIDTIEHNAPANNFSRRVNQPHQRITRHRFAGARFTDQTQHLATRHRKRNAVHRLDHASLGEKMGLQIFDFEYGGHNLQPEKREPPMDADERR